MVKYSKSKRKLLGSQEKGIPKEEIPVGTIKKAQQRLWFGWQVFTSWRGRGCEWTCFDGLVQTESLAIHYEVNL